MPFNMDIKMFLKILLSAVCLKTSYSCEYSRQHVVWCVCVSSAGPIIMSLFQTARIQLKAAIGGAVLSGYSLYRCMPEIRP